MLSHTLDNGGLGLGMFLNDVPQKFRLVWTLLVTI